MPSSNLDGLPKELVLRQKILAFVQKVSAKPHVAWVIADQGLVSGCNFAVGVLLARLLGLEGYGHFVLLNAALLYMNTFPGAMLITPLMALGPQQKGESDRLLFFRGSLTLQLALSTALACVGGGIGVLALPAWISWIGPEHIVALAFVVFTFQIQDWLRRHFFVQLQGRRAFIIDLVSYGGYVLTLPALHYFDRLTVITALWALGAFSALGAVVGILVARIVPSVAAARAIAAVTWRSSLNYLLSWQLQWISAQGVIFAGASVLGPQAAGAIRAVQNIVGPLNVALQLLENLVPVRGALLYAKQGKLALKRWLGRYAFVVGSAFIAVFVVVLAFSDQLVMMAYGDAYVAYAGLLFWHCGFFLLNLCFKFISYYFRIVDVTFPITISSLVSAMASVAIAFALVGTLRETGVMVGLVAGQLLANICLLVFGRVNKEKIARG